MDVEKLAKLGMSAGRLEQVSKWLSQQVAMERVAGATRSLFFAVQAN